MQSKPAELELPDRIHGSCELIHKQIASEPDSRKVNHGGQRLDLIQTRDEMEGTLTISTPPSLLKTDDTEVATFTINGNLLKFRWNSAVVNQARLAEPIRDAAFKFDLKGRGDCYVLFRSPKLRTERVGLKRIEDAPKNGANSNTHVVDWADARTLENCKWDVVIIDWRIRSSLKDQALTHFASEKPIKNSNVKCSVLNELEFQLKLNKNKLIAQFFPKKDLEKNFQEAQERRKDFEAEQTELRKSLDKLKESLDQEDEDGGKEKKKKSESRKSLQDRRDGDEKRLKFVDDMLKDLARKIPLYDHWLNSDRMVLDVGIGLRLSDGDVVEINRLGPRWGAVLEGR